MLGRLPKVGSSVAGLLLLLALGLAGGGARAGEETPLEAGLAVVDLTPAPGVALGGYAARWGRPSLAVHDAVEARALVLRQGDRSVALVSVDLVGVSRRVTELVRRRVADLGLDDVVLTATHTHAGPGGLTTVPLWRTSMGAFDRGLFARTAARIEAAIRRAYADLDPAVIRAGRTSGERLRGAVRRRAEVGVEPDASLGVIRIDRPDGSPRGAVVHFGAHPTLIGAGVRAISAGWPGAARREVERRLPGVTAIFLQGAEGDVSPVTPPNTSPDVWAKVAAYGRLVGDAAIEEYGRLGERDRERIGLVVEGTRIAHVPTVAAALLGGSPESALLGSWSVPVARLRLGTLELVTVPGEPTSAVAKRMGAGSARWILACAQDHLGYFVDRPTWRAARDMEAELCLFGPGIADTLTALADGDPPPLAEAPPGAPTADVPVEPVVLRAPTGGGPRGLGREHGRRLAVPIRGLLAAAERALEDEALGHGAGLLLAPVGLATGLSPRDMVMPLLVRAVRKLQRHAPPALLDEMEAVAGGAGVPFDAILLENMFLTLAEQPDKRALLALPARCTNLVAVGDATSMGQLIHGSTLDWGMHGVLADRVAILVMEPDTGHPFVSVTWPGMVGTLRAMGAQGIALTEESCAAPDDTTTDGVPVNLLMRDVVQHASSLEDAVRRVVDAPGTCGYKITVSDGRELDARVVEVTAHHHHVRAPRGGLLYGCDPESPCVGGDCDPRIPRNDGSSARRYPVVRTRLEGRRERIRVTDVEAALSSRDGGVLNGGTLLACVFEPQLLRFHVARGDGLDARAGRLAFVAYDLAPLLSPAARERYTPPWPVTDTGDIRARVKLEDFLGMRVEELSIPSPVRSGSARNDRFTAELYTPKDPIGVVIQLPHWKDPSGGQGQKLVAVGLAREGIASVLLPLPWQYGRTPDGASSGERTLSRDLARTREAAFQGVADVLRVGLWLERERGYPPSRQALLGLSLGGHIASLAYGATPDRFAGAALLLAGSHRQGAIFRKNGVTDSILARLRERDVTFEEARGFLLPIDPAALARPALADRVLIVAGTEDPVVPREAVEALAQAWGGARVSWFEGDHYSVIRHVADIIHAVTEHVRRRFAASDPTDGRAEMRR